MNKKNKTIFIIIGVLLLLNGVGNIVDDARVLVYDITAILSGLGFLLIVRSKK